MWLKKLKNKKLQCFLIGLLLFLSALIFASSLSLITSINTYVKNYYGNSNYYNLIVYDAKESSKNNVLNWCKGNPKVEDVKTLDAFNSGNNIYLNNKKVKTTDYDVIPLQDYKNIPYGISKIKSLNSSSCPAEGEVWITQLFADTNKISLGDTLEFRIDGSPVSLKVTSLINDSLQPSHILTKYMLYINKKDIPHFSSAKKVDYIFINSKKNVDAQELGKSLNDAVDVGGLTGVKSLLIQAATMVSSIVGGVSALASLLIFAVSIFIIRFIIWNNILKEYKSIGIYKALGFTKREILKFYILGYSLTAFIGSTLGALCSIPLLNYIVAKVIKYIGNFNSVNINSMTILITIFLFSFIVITNLYFVIKRTNKISPVEALRTGITSSKKKLTKSFIKNSSSPLALAINDIFKYKKSTVYITISLILSLYLIILFGNLTFTVLKMKDHSNVWFGDPKCNMYISLNGINSNKEFNTVLKNIDGNENVKSYTYGSPIVNNVKFDTKKYHMKTSLYGVMSMNSYNSSQGLDTISGHNPKSDNEVAVTLNMLKDSGLSVGDYIEISVNNKKADYLISGSYSTFASSGYQIRMLNSEIEKYNPDYVYNEMFVNLKNKSTMKIFENNINKKYSYACAGDTEPNNKDLIEAIPNLINPITFLLIAVFTVFSVIIVFNIIIMNIRDNRKNFGIMKALGFTSSEIRNRYLYRMTILTVLSSIIAVILNMLFSKSIIKTAMGGMNVLINSKFIIATSIAAMFILITVIVLACSIVIKNTKPTELIEE